MALIALMTIWEMLAELWLPIRRLPVARPNFSAG
jgi:hypothetical protein